MGEIVSDSVLPGNGDTISGPGSNQAHIGGPTTNLARSAHIVPCGPAVPSWSPAILYRGQWSACNFKSGANTIRGRINYSSTHDRRRYFSVGSQFCCTYQNWRLYISWLHWILNILWFLEFSSNSFIGNHHSGFLKSIIKIINFDNIYVQQIWSWKSKEMCLF